MVSCSEDDDPSNNPGSNFLTFARNYGTPFNNVGCGILETEDCGFYLGGHADIDGNNNYKTLVIRTDSNGDTLWQKYYGDEGNYYCRDIFYDNYGGLLFSGYTDSEEYYHRVSYLARIDSSGNRSWTAFFAIDLVTYPKRIIRTNSGSFALYCQAESLNGFNENSILILVDIEGDEENYYTFPSHTSPLDYGLCQADNGDFLISTHQEESDGNVSYLVAVISRINESGEIIWEYLLWDTYPIKYCNSIIKASDGGFILTGVSDDPELRDGSTSIPFIAKLDENGNDVWYHDFSFIPEGYGYNIITTSDGGYAITGTGFSDQVFLLKTDSDGEVMWWQEYSDYMAGGETSLIETADGGFALIGSSSSAMNSRMVLLKTDPNGCVY